MNNEQLIKSVLMIAVFILAVILSAEIIPRIIMSKLLYNTRDSKGNDIIKEIEIKKYPTEEMDYICPFCNKHKQKGINIKKIVSSDFTDWAYVGDYVCESCADLFSLYFYNYIVDDNGIHLYNVREIEEQLCKEQKPPFLFIITTTRKKHLFYKSVWNYTADKFAVNLETETIFTDTRRMRKLFDFVDSVITLGGSKQAMQNGNISFNIVSKVGLNVIKWLNDELISSREIQIPLYCGQKRDISEEEAICNINSILKA